MGEAEIVLGMEDVARELAACARGWEPDARLLGNVRAADVAIVADAYPALLARLRDAERERYEARNGKAGIEDILQTLHAQVAEMCAFAGASPDAPQDSWTLRDRLVVLVRERTRDDHDYVVACRERDEARAALIQAQEDHRAAVEGLETYEERIGDIADHVLGLVAPDVPSIIKLDAIERRCGEERIAARRAEARVRELEEERDFILNGEFADLTKLRAIADAAEALRDATRARLTGAVEDALSIQASEEVVFLYCHRASLPELVALVRAVGRDCTIGPFAERWAWIRVHATGGAP